MEWRDSSLAHKGRSSAACGWNVVRVNVILEAWLVTKKNDMNVEKTNSHKQDGGLRNRENNVFVIVISFLREKKNIIRSSSCRCYSLCAMPIDMSRLLAPGIRRIG